MKCWKRLEKNVATLVDRGERVIALRLNKEKNTVDFRGSQEMRKFIDDSIVLNKFIEAATAPGTSLNLDGIPVGVLRLDDSLESTANLKKVVVSLVSDWVYNKHKMHRGFWGIRALIPEWYPADVGFYSPHDNRTKRNRPTREDLKKIIQCYKNFMMAGTENMDDAYSRPSTSASAIENGTEETDSQVTDTGYSISTQDNEDTEETMPGRGKKRVRESEGETTEKNAKRHRITHKSHADAIKPGVVLACGEGDVGQLGLGPDIMERSRPALVDVEGEQILSVVAGGMHTVCITTKGEVYTFGCNDEGALGRDTSEEGSETKPGKVACPGHVVQVTAGDSHSAALTDEGKVYAWGNFRDANGKMGLTSKGVQEKPMQLLADETIVKISSGGDHLIMLTEKGDIFTCGCAEQGQLGRVAECFALRGGRKGLDYILDPAIVRCKKFRSRKKASFSDIFAGQYITFAKEKESGDIYGWGLNNYHQLGFDSEDSKFVPERVTCLSEGKDFVSIDGGQHHTVLLDSAGKVYTLGRGDYGRLGHGDDVKELQEPSALDLPTCTAISAGQAVSFALTEDGDVYAWGMGTSQQLASGDDEDVSTPQKMAGKQLLTRKVISVCGGGQHTTLLARDNN